MRKEKRNSIVPQFITNDKGEKISVILPIRQYLKMLEKIEESEDVKLYDEVKAKNEKRISLDDYIKSGKKNNAALQN